jgi:hypothetical protein
MAGATGLEPATFGAGSAEVLQLPVLVLAEDDGVTANNKSAARRAGTPVARRDILWATCRTVGRATSASQAEFL